jgi:hypothetical protein
VLLGVSEGSREVSEGSREVREDPREAEEGFREAEEGSWADRAVRKPAKICRRIG